MKFDDALTLVGRTPMLRLRNIDLRSDRNIYLKLEGSNPTGSIKDRACVGILRGLENAGHLEDGMTLLDASSGNMACSLAYFGRVLGFSVTVVAGSKLTQDKREFIDYFAGEVVQHGEFTADGARWCRELVERVPGKYCFMDQLHNPSNPQANYETTGPEILADCPDVRLVIGSLGSGGSLLGIGRYLKERIPDVVIVAVEAASGSRMPGVGSFADGDYVTPFIREGEENGIFDRRVTVTEAQAIDRLSVLVDQGVFAGLSTGAVVEAAARILPDATVPGDVVLLSGDSGWKSLRNLREL